MSKTARNTPIIVGIGEVKNKDPSNSCPIEPADLIVEAIYQAAADASISARLSVTLDSLFIVPPWTWPYPDLPGLIASKLQANPKHLHLGHHGGNEPALVCDEAARRISSGDSKLAIIAGGEALASLAACQKAGQLPPPGWTAPDAAQKAISASDLSLMGENAASRHGMGLAIHVYPMYENAFRAYSHQSQEDNQKESAQLYAEFDRIACQHPSSWRFGETPRDSTAIGVVTSKNRMICTPYPLLMNAFNTVNLAAACILTSVEHAEKLGIPREKWIYVLGGAGTNVADNFWERSSYHSSPSLEQSIDGALQASGLKMDDVDCYDIYSCFPIVPKLACKHLGLSTTNPSKPISLLGGLTSFGGAGNNYSMHAIIEMVRQLRAGIHRNGMVLANGGLLTHHHAICLSSPSREDSAAYPARNPLPDHVDNSRVPQFQEHAQGAAFIETYTVAFDRKGSPEVAHIVGRLKSNGHRFLANHGDELTLQKLTAPGVEPVGMHGFVHQGKDGRNLFTVNQDARL